MVSATHCRGLDLVPSLGSEEIRLRYPENSYLVSLTDRENPKAGFTTSRFPNSLLDNPSYR